MPISVLLDKGISRARRWRQATAERQDMRHAAEQKRPGAGPTSPSASLADASTSVVKGGDENLDADDPRIRLTFR